MNITTARAQELRRNMTKEELHLWLDFLKEYKIPFRRQYSVGNYILDFYCPQARLAVELDGSQHFDPEGKAYDAARTEFLEGHGIRVIRFSNLQIAREFPNVCEAIMLAVQHRIEERNICPHPASRRKE